VIFGTNHPDTSVYITIRKFSPTLQHCYVDIKNARGLYRQRRTLNKSFSKGKKHDTASQFLKEYANSNWSRR